MNRIKAGALKLLRHPARLVSMGRLGILWYSAYFGAQEETKNISTSPTDSPLDERVAIEEQAIYSYLFACLYLPGSALLLVNMLNEEEFPHAIQAYESLILKSKQAFLARPTQIKTRRLVTHPLIRFLQSIDGPTNCFPSLHVGLVVLTYEIVNNSQSDFLSILPAMKQSCIDICRATLKTRQHSIIDVIGGIALAEQIYKQHFEGGCEDLLPEIIPELHASENESARHLIERGDEPLALMDALIEQFVAL